MSKQWVATAVQFMAAVYQKESMQNGSISHLIRVTQQLTYVLGTMLGITLFIIRLSETTYLRGNLSVMVQPQKQYQ